MHLHDLQISWKEIAHWLSHCFNHCLHAPWLLLASPTAESAEKNAPLNIPTEYQDRNEVASKTQTSGLLMAYDCAAPARDQPPILPYLSSLHSGITSSGGMSSRSTAIGVYIYIYMPIHVLEKKGGGIWPCSDCRGLNQITVKYCYPLPLISLCSTCNLVPPHSRLHH